MVLPSGFCFICRPRAAREWPWSAQPALDPFGIMPKRYNFHQYEESKKTSTKANESEWCSLSPRTIKLYDRRQDEISLDEIERITI